ncbi:MAG: Gfo/Idh/MocA family oxidoreductase [Verrucomicrobia bacterium]|nr:Gfo/Idh/MocA family oxidoreductase [Verrucomicrobiota bacterium]MCG2680139.1 Gfo/Idh/MocA family oxidoreductase [Kiritimatiellia bacterium]MBU4247048.1 Gfo/Idh/MocA family oxidoreductase [Verrucomicrobiota bacterium]MBU4291122.1 Gfo/Idh/MocA family oxidoreductase [Verrucomicrobiota bacterium]MBU4429509.1 Gfo/Idh/MocA family oxidoreductase [Verrucomicrobiota bacterium]
MSRTIRVGIVGCGGIARAHVNGYKGNKGVTIVAVYDVRPQAADKLAEETGARVVGSLDEMVKGGDLDAVSICSPPAMHLDNCMPFLKAGIGILCEKPLEVNAGKAGQLAALSRRSRSVFMTAFCHRFHPAIVELKGLIDRDILGKPLLFRNIFGGYLALKGNHRTDPKLSGGGCLADNCAHSVDLFRFLVGDPVAAQAMAGNIMQKLRIEDFGMINLATRGSAAFGEITSSYSLKVCGNFVEWYGTKGTAIVSYWNPGFPDLSYKVEGGNAWKPVDCAKHPDRFVGEVRHFLDCVRRRKQPAITAADGFKAACIIRAIYQSAGKGKRIPVSYR